MPDLQHHLRDRRFQPRAEFVSPEIEPRGDASPGLETKLSQARILLKSSEALGEVVVMLIISQAAAEHLGEDFPGAGGLPSFAGPF
jgi:hypothetical protein